MLVLSRKEEEVIQIGDDITIKIVRIGRAKVRIGIEAPIDVSITRPLREAGTEETDSQEANS